MFHCNENHSSNFLWIFLSSRLRAQICCYRTALLLEGAWGLGPHGEEAVVWGCTWGAAAYLQDLEGGISLNSNGSQLQSVLHPPSPSRTPSAKHNLSAAWTHVSDVGSRSLREAEELLCGHLRLKHHTEEGEMEPDECLLCEVWGLTSLMLHAPILLLTELAFDLNYTMINLCNSTEVYLTKLSIRVYYSRVALHFTGCN